MSKRRKTTAELVIELRDFHHDEAADRLEWLQDKVDELTWMREGLEK